MDAGEEARRLFDLLLLIGSDDSRHSSHAALAAMFVITRSGAKEPCRFDKITDRITSLAYGLHEMVEPVRGQTLARAAHSHGRCVRG